MIKEKNKPLDRLYGFFQIGKEVAEILVLGVPHLLETKASEDTAEIEKHIQSITSRVGEVPVSELEKETGADMRSYHSTHEGYSMSSLYKGPKSSSEAEARSARIEQEFQQIVSRRAKR